MARIRNHTHGCQSRSCCYLGPASTGRKPFWRGKSSAMRVAIVHDFLMQMGGAEKVVEVLHAMFPDAPVYTSAYDA